MGYKTLTRSIDQLAFLQCFDIVGLAFSSVLSKDLLGETYPQTSKLPQEFSATPAVKLKINNSTGISY